MLQLKRSTFTRDEDTTLSQVVEVEKKHKRAVFFAS